MNFKFLSLCSLLSVGMLFSCKDDNSMEVDNPSAFPEIETGMPDVSAGYVMRILEIDDEFNPQSFTWKLGTKRELEVYVKDENGETGILDLHVETDPETGLKSLVCDKIDLSNVDLSVPKLLYVYLKLHKSDQSRVMRVVLRKKVGTVGSEDPLFYASDKIGFSMCPADEFRSTISEALLFGSFSQGSQNQEKELVEENIQDGRDFEMGGKRYSDIKQAYALNVGFKGNFKTKNGMLKTSLNGSYNSSDEYIDNYEYYIAAIRREEKSVSISNSLLLQKEKLATHLTASLNDVLNCPGSDLYGKFSNDEEGMKALFQTYGTHIITRGTFGGEYDIIYSRQENIHSHDIGVDVSASISHRQRQEKPNTEATAVGNGLSNFFTMIGGIMSSRFIKGTADGSYSEDDYQEAIESKLEIGAKGAYGVTDLEVWQNEVMSDKSWWVITRYEKPSKIDDDDTSNLLPLYELILDQIQINEDGTTTTIPAEKTARYQAMVAYMDSYIDSKMLKPVQRKLVLADFMMEAGESSRHEDGPKPKAKVCNMQKENLKLLYVPLYMNYNAPKEYQDQIGYALDTNQNKFVNAAGGNSHYWYVAYGYEGDVKPLSDIRFAKADEMGEDKSDEEGGENLKFYHQRGNNANEGITAALNDNYVYVKLHQEGDGTAPITAIALASNKGESDQWGDLIYASTYGAEWRSDYASTYTNFSEWWNTNGKCSDIKEGFYEGGLIETDVDVHVVYSTAQLLYPWPSTGLSWGYDEKGDPYLSSPYYQSYLEWNE